VVGQCLDQGLVDELLIFLVPVILGAGVRLFDHTTRRSIKLEPTSVNQTGAITNLRLRVVKSGPRVAARDGSSVVAALVDTVLIPHRSDVYRPR
jgi:dihydrofolate reductase